jgi:hypothetical protein
MKIFRQDSWCPVRLCHARLTYFISAYDTKNTVLFNFTGKCLGSGLCVRNSECCNLSTLSCMYTKMNNVKMQMDCMGIHLG